MKGIIVTSYIIYLSYKIIIKFFNLYEIFKTSYNLRRREYHGKVYYRDLK